jgi:cytochrome c553
MKNTLALAAVFGIMTSSALAAEPAAKGDPAKAQQIVTQVCAACHGADGNSTNPKNPKLAGQFYEYLDKQLNNFKSGDRKSVVMQGIVSKLSPSDFPNLAAFFSEKTMRPGAGRDPALVEQGMKVFKGGNQASGVPACASCHGPTGAGIPIEFPRLGGQHAEYIVTQLMNFRSGDRANDGGKMMRTIAQKLTDQEMKAVAQYIAGLH